TKPIVRVNQPHDAFEILTYDLLFRKNKYGEQLTKENISELELCIVPPPDDTIDIFYEEEDGDDYLYHIVQVKNTVLAEAEIKACFASMKRSVDTFIKKRIDVGENLRQVVSETNFDDDNNECIYYLVHGGEIDSIKGQKKDERIITENDLEIILKSVVNFCVPFEKIETDRTNNFIAYSNTDETTDEKYSAYQVNLNAYDLAVLCNKYINSEIGKNILFGQNLREALSTGSRTFAGMCKTLENEPQNFWFYNNGITIIAEEVDLKRNERGRDVLSLTNFSIINGAQTTSAFGNYLKIADRDDTNADARKKKENLRKAFVTARVVETKENKSLRGNITIFNNTQNPISSRDMVSNNEEQKQLQKKFLDNEAPNIFIQIRRGESKPKHKYFEKHQVISNDELAQYVFAGFLSSPYTAKDKKNSLFNRDNTTNDYEINKEYHSVFNYSNDKEKQGELFKRSKDEVNELLFIKLLHNRAKKFLKDNYTTKIETLSKVLENPSSDVKAKESAERTIEVLRKYKQINNVNTFYNIALYYEFKRQFDSLIGASLKKFDFKNFYGRDKVKELELIKAFAELFTTETNELINELGHKDPPKFTRGSTSPKIFFAKLTEKLAINPVLQDKYSQFVSKYKI
ncbi:MAG: AIPR family protein, partial [Thermoproteota archaeon]|nr:AIPR family protein [Thermoproteota archaeon]